MSMRVEVVAVEGLGEIRSGDDLAAMIHAASPVSLADGDVVVITSKVVSKAAGLVFEGDRDELLEQHAVRVVARRGQTRIVRTPHGLTLAAAGLDASNTPPGTVVALPADPDAEACRIRRRLGELAAANVAVVVTDTAGRAWRQGQTDIAIGVAGLAPIENLADTTDSHGNRLAVTAPAIADEIAGASDLVQGKTSGVPVAVVRGLADRVLPADVDGTGASALVRSPDADLFGWGAADAVRVAVRRDAADAADGFPQPVDVAATLIDDATAATDETAVKVLPIGGPGRWRLVAVTGVRPEIAAWEAGAFVERLLALAVSTRRTVTVDRDPAEPGVLATVTVSPA
jgi:coenzyme F420-0:L-glutamate ligase/coenzyme F420-1:gamma-L-glutamate ligase